MGMHIDDDESCRGGRRLNLRRDFWDALTPPLPPTPPLSPRANGGDQRTSTRWQPRVSSLVFSNQCSLRRTCCVMLCVKRKQRVIPCLCSWRFWLDFITIVCVREVDWKSYHKKGKNANPRNQPTPINKRLHKQFPLCLAQHAPHFFLQSSENT